MSFKVKINNKEFSFEKKVKLVDLTEGNEDYICAKVNNQVRELNYEVYYDANVTFLTLKNSCAIGTYRRSVVFLFLMAAHLVYPKYRFKISYSFSRCLYAQEISNHEPMSEEMTEAIENKMQELVKEDFPFVKMIVPNDDAKKIYEGYKLTDKIEILQYRPEKTVHFYNCNGYLNYMFGRMVPSTGYLKLFKLRTYSPGILISYPRAEYDGQIPPYKEETVFSNALFNSYEWSNKVHLSSVAEINTQITTPTANNLINICEDKHYRMLVELGNIIENKIDSVRLICIAGPSSSGKTTFANRLVDELKSRGINPIRISLDDYYLDKDLVPLDENGEKDFETIDSLDKKLFMQNMLDLLNGKKVDLPKFNFKKNERVVGRSIQIGPKDPIIVEGIHALNEQMTSLIPKHNKFKIFISPQVQINLDNENPISMSDVRLLRRIVRDNQFRSSSAEETLSMWRSVRKGEFKWIYSTQEDANYVFDSFLNYELCVMKRYALPLLKSISKDSKYFPDAERLIRLLKYYKDIDPKFVPCNSLLHEFIGGSSY